MCRKAGARMRPAWYLIVSLVAAAAAAAAAARSGQALF